MRLRLITFGPARPRLLAVVAPLVLCAGTAIGTAPVQSAHASSPTCERPGEALVCIIASTDLSIGRDRFTFGLLAVNHPLEVPRVSVEFFSFHGTGATATQRLQARFNYFARGLKDTDANRAAIEIGGVFVAYPTFKHAGTWGILITAPYHGHRYVLRDEFTVKTHGTTPDIGSAAPRSHNPTTAQEPASKLDSGRPPDDMHRLSIAAAIAQHRPLVVLFATAAFCTSRLCGPEIGVVQGLERKYRRRVNFIHIEIFKDAQYSHGFAPTVKQWGLVTEPWVFVIDRRGFITAKFEGPTPVGELDPAIQKVLH
ncbi:MAG: TlpA family protein disulfide reductase [Chloroflexota bacterium]